jgi:hypothetical protein
LAKEVAGLSGENFSRGARLASTSGSSLRWGATMTGALALIFSVLVLVGMPAAAAGFVATSARTSDFTDCTSTPTTVCLRLWTSGFGKIEATVAGVGTTTCDYTDIINNERECPAPVPRDSSVTLTATPELVQGTATPSEFSLRMSRHRFLHFQCSR